MNRNLDPKNSEPLTGPGLIEAYRLVGHEIDQLRHARQAIDAQLEKAEAAQGLLRQLLREPAIGTPPANAMTLTKRFHRGSKTFEVVTRCKTLLLQAGRPLHRAELLRRLQESGFNLTTRNPARFVGRTLWENPDFIHIPKNGYWIAGEALPTVD